MPGHYIIYWRDNTTTSLKARDFKQAFKEACKVEGIKCDLKEATLLISRIVYLP